jgi:hypothetical protein
MNKDKHTHVITDISAIDFTSTEEEPTNVVELDIDPLPEELIKALEESDE